MLSPSMNDLPVELQTSILRFLLSFSRPPVRRRHRRPGLSEWVEEDLRKPSLFFNAASVCKLWRDILAQIPECWTRVVFNLENDPAPFLDAFLWSKNLKEIEVVVFSSTDPQVVDKAREKRLVSAVARALQPHIHRCKSIIFDITYSSSLPPPTIVFLQELPNLEELALNCRVDDIHLTEDSDWATTMTKDRPFATRFPMLQKLSLTGFWFMCLVLHANNTQWLRLLQCNFISICISSFKFMQYGHYTLPKFASYLAQVENASSFHFRDLTLSYEYKSSYEVPDCGRLPQIDGDIHFQSVSKDFLAHIYAITHISPDDSLSFDNCEIPNIKQVQGGYLELENIIDDDQGHSLRNILGAWSGNNLSIHSCSSFNDAVLSWLGSEVEYARPSIELGAIPNSLDAESVLHYSHRFVYSDKPFKTFPAESMSYISIVDCDNFTPRVLRDVIKVRNDASRAEDALDPGRHHGRRGSSEKQSVLTLFARGRIPALTEEDKEWFQGNVENMTVRYSQTSHNPCVR